MKPFYFSISSFLPRGGCTFGGFFFWLGGTPLRQSGGVDSGRVGGGGACVHDDVDRWLDG